MPHDLSDTAFWIQRVELNLSLVQLMTLHGNLVLALRHPGQKDGLHALDFAREILERIEMILRETGALTDGDIAEAHADD